MLKMTLATPNIGVYVLSEVCHEEIHLLADVQLYLISEELINTYNNAFLKFREQAEVFNTVPRILWNRFGAFGFVALQETRHEKFFRQGCKHNATGFTVADRFLWIFWVDQFNDRTRLWWIVDKRSCPPDRKVYTLLSP